MYEFSSAITIFKFHDINKNILNSESFHFDKDTNIPTKTHPITTSSLKIYQS